MLRRSAAGSYCYQDSALSARRSVRDSQYSGAGSRRYQDLALMLRGFLQPPAVGSLAENLVPTRRSARDFDQPAVGSLDLDYARAYPMIPGFPQPVAGNH